MTSDRIARAEPPTPITRNAKDVLRELGVLDASKDAQREAVSENAWRLRPEEIEWLQEELLTDLTREVSELMAKGWPEPAAREAIALKHGQIGPGTTKT